VTSQTINRTNNAVNQTADKTSDVITTGYENLFATYQTWFDRAQEVREVVSNAYLENFQTVIERNRDAYRQTEAYTQRVADLQKDWVSEMARQFRGYQTQAFETTSRTSWPRSNHDW
jgi:hypothetical protein